MNSFISKFMLTCLIAFSALNSVAQTSMFSPEVLKADAERDKVLGKNIVPIDKGCVIASQYAKAKLIEKQNSKFNLSSAVNDVKTSQMAFIQKSTLTAYLAFIDTLEPTEINPTLMSSQYMLSCLTYVRH